MKIRHLTILFFAFLFSINAFTQNISVSPRGKGFEAARTGIIRIIFDNNVEVLDKANSLTIIPKTIEVTEEKIIFKNRKDTIVLNFSGAIDDTIHSPAFTRDKSIVRLNKYEFLIRPWRLRNYDILNELDSHLTFLQNLAKRKRYESQLDLFKTVAEKYRELKIKPQVSEEQRKFIVQANLFNQKKMYDKAIDLYKQAIEVDETAYPAGYSNLALLCAQTSNFDVAIFYMKKYLMLEPEASDARGAQDKIYEWEASIAK